MSGGTLEVVDIVLIQHHGNKKLDLKKWEPRFKAFGAVATVVSMIGLVAGGVFGLYRYVAQQEKEIRLAQYNQKKELYYELVDAAAAVGSSLTKDEALRNAQKYSILYFGRAHIFVIDPEVVTGKEAFHKAMENALQEGVFPSKQLQLDALSLAMDCANVLHINDVFGESSAPKAVTSEGKAKAAK